MNKSIMLGCFLFAAMCGSLAAFDEAVHNAHLRQLLFGRASANETCIEPLGKALYLTIDLFNGASYNNGQAQRYLDSLKQFGVKNVPKLEMIDFTAGAHHQRYTHRGWDWTLYPTNYRGYNFQQIWNIRQQSVLLPTVDAIFKFKREEMIKRDSFAALLYYLHIIGDHFGDSKRTYPDRMPLTPRPDYRLNRSGENSYNPTIYTELLYHLPRLFRDQTSSPNYQMLIRHLERNKNREFSTGTTISDEEYTGLQSFANETLETLIKYIPPLLRNERFFHAATQK